MSEEFAGSDVDAFESDLSFEMPGESPAAPTEPDEELAANVATAEETIEETPAEEEAQPAPAQAPAAPAAKQLQFKVGDKTVPIDESAMVEWKVDGKPTPVAVKDLLQNYAGKVAWEKRLNDVALERKTVTADKQATEAERTRHRNMITDLHTKMQAGKTLEAVSALVEMTGLKVDPRQYVKQLRDVIIQQAQQLAQMSPEDRSRHELDEEREYIASQRRSWEQQRQAEQTQREFGQRVAKAVQQSGVPEEEFSQTYSWLQGRAKENGGDPAQVTPEYVVSHLATKRAYEVARDAIGSVEPELIEGNIVKDEARWDKLAKLVGQHPEFTMEEFAEMYREARQAKLAKTVSRKVTKAPTPTAASAAARAKPNQANELFNPRSPKITSDDLEW